jgi:hypothetical protein
MLFLYIENWLKWIGFDVPGKETEMKYGKKEVCENKD